jgi:Uma2 family endonuclease
LREYALIAQERLHLEQFVRQSEGHWLLSEWSGGDAKVSLGSIGATLVLAEVYDKVDL